MAHARSRTIRQFLSHALGNGHQQDGSPGTTGRRTGGTSEKGRAALVGLGLLATAACAPTTVALVGPAGQQFECRQDTPHRTAVAMSSTQAAALMQWEAHYRATTGRSPTLVERCVKMHEAVGYRPAPQPGPARTYVSSSDRWSVSYPSGWSLDDKKSGYVRMNYGSAVVGIHVVRITAGKPLDEIADTALAGWQRHIRLEVVTVSRQRVTLSSGLPAIEVVHLMGSGVVGKSRKVIAAVNNRLFVIDAETIADAWPGFEADFNHIINSFTVRD